MQTGRRPDASHDSVPGSFPDEITLDLEATHEITRRGYDVVELSKELTISSKALLQEIDPII